MHACVMKYNILYNQNTNIYSTSTTNIVEYICFHLARLRNWLSLKWKSDKLDKNVHEERAKMELIEMGNGKDKVVG